MKENVGTHLEGNVCNVKTSFLVLTRELYTIFQLLRIYMLQDFLLTLCISFSTVTTVAQASFSDARVLKHFCIDFKLRTDQVT